MAIYDTEEEQLEQLKKWWEANNSSLIAGVAVALVIITGWNFWQNQQQEKRQQASLLYQQLLEGAAKNDGTLVTKLADQITVEHSSTAYAHYAALEKAKSQVNHGDLDGAKAILQQQFQQADSDELRHVARLRLLQLLIASREYEAGLKLIAEVDPAKEEGFAASYDELEGDIYVALDRLDEARNVYQSAIRSGQASPLVQFKLDDIAAPVLTSNSAK